MNADEETTKETKEETKDVSKDALAEAQELVRDWTFLFWALLLWTPLDLTWTYFHPPLNRALHIGVCLGFFFSGFLGFAMRYVMRGKLMG